MAKAGFVEQLIQWLDWDFWVIDPMEWLGTLFSDLETPYIINMIGSLSFAQQTRRLAKSRAGAATYLQPASKLTLLSNHFTTTPIIFSHVYLFL